LIEITSISIQGKKGGVTQCVMIYFIKNSIKTRAKIP
jgi:hypothetical protein